jgi:hypothetical protein
VLPITTHATLFSAAGAARRTTMHTSDHHGPICIPKLPPFERWAELARQARDIDPDYVPENLDLEHLEPEDNGKLSLDITLRWSKKGVKLTVGFLDNPEAALRTKILNYMNKWSARGNVSFVESHTDPQVRIARVPNDGYWSWLGIDILNHPGEPTMNLDSFTMNTPDSEFDRVVCHETGHTLGFPHEHLRKELVGLLDYEKTIKYFKRTQGWTRADVIYQVLTPLDNNSLLRTPRADQRSIMCYDIPGECTKTGKPIIGGTHIDQSDYDFIAKVYPKALL